MANRLSREVLFSGLIYIGTGREGNDFCTKYGVQLQALGIGFFRQRTPGIGLGMAPGSESYLGKCGRPCLSVPYNNGRGASISQSIICVRGRTCGDTFPSCTALRGQADLLAFLVFVLVFEVEGWGRFTCCGFSRQSAVLASVRNPCTIRPGPQ